MLLEDDWLLCPHGLLAVYHAIDKSYAYDPHWIALRVSYGFNGGGLCLCLILSATLSATLSLPLSLPASPAQACSCIRRTCPR